MHIDIPPKCCFIFGTKSAPSSTAISTSKCDSGFTCLLLWQSPDSSSSSLVGIRSLQAPTLLLLLMVTLSKYLSFYLQIKLEAQRPGWKPASLERWSSNKPILFPFWHLPKEKKLRPLQSFFTTPTVSLHPLQQPSDALWSLSVN